MDKNNIRSTKISKIDKAKFSELKYVAWNFSSLSDVSKLRVFIKCMTEMHQQTSRNNLFFEFCLFLLSILNPSLQGCIENCRQALKY